MRSAISILLLVCLSLPVLAGYPQRIVSGIPSITEMLFALGLEERIVGVTSNCNYPPAAKNKEKVGGFFLNLEKVVSLDPDMIVMLESAQSRDVKKFRDFGLPVQAINPKSVHAVMDAILGLGSATGTRAKAEEIVGGMKKRLEIIEHNVTQSGPKDELVQAEESAENGEVEIVQYRILNIRQPQVLIIIGLNPLVVVGGENLIDDMLSYTGAQNIAKKTNAAYPQYSFETLMSEDPDFIIVPEGLVSKSEMKQDSRWKSLSAVRNDNLIFVNADKLSRPGPRVVEAIEEIAGFIYQ